MSTEWVSMDFMISALLTRDDRHGDTTGGDSQ